MILQALYQLYDRLKEDSAYEVAPPGRSHQKISFVVVLTREGALVDIQDSRQPVDGRLVPKRVLVLGTTKPSGSGLNPCFLWDAPSYLLGYDPDRPKRAARTFDAFRRRHIECEREIDVPEFSAVCRFLESWSPDCCQKFPVLSEASGGFGVFQIRGDPGYVHEHQRISEWWDAREAEGEVNPTGQCLVTGRESLIARTHPKIKGVFKAQPSGATIAGFNDTAYWSYGMTQSFNAPVSEDAAHRYTTALNALLEGPCREKHRIAVGQMSVVFWTERPTASEDIFLAFAGQGAEPLKRASTQDETLRAKLDAFLSALRAGREAYAELDADSTINYFILGLAAPTPARVTVRFFHQGVLSHLLGNLRRHYHDIETERRFQEGSKFPDPEFPDARTLLRETARDEGEVPPLLASSLLEAIVTGWRYPAGLYAAVMRRIVAERSVNYAKACAIKGFLVRNLGMEVPVSLDVSRTDAAYRLGRLFATLEKTQQDALGSLNSTIRERFYASASATPAVIVPRLLRTYQHHLAKLAGGRKVNREKLMQEILSPLATIPSHLSLADQGLFALGYYHQMNAFFTKKSEQAEIANT